MQQQQRADNNVLLLMAGSAPMPAPSIDPVIVPTVSGVDAALKTRLLHFVFDQLMGIK